MSKYWVDFYAWVGEHGELSDSSSENFAPAFKEAKAFYRREKKAKHIDQYGYIGVSGQGLKFAIVYVAEEYAKNMVNPNHFSNQAQYDAWMEAAKEFLKTGKAVKGTFSKKMAQGGKTSARDRRVDEVAKFLTKGYMDVVLFTGMDDNDESLDRNYSRADFDANSEISIGMMMKKFAEDNLDLIENSGLDIQDIGGDICYTQGGHGTGFFERAISKEKQKEFEAAVKALGVHDPEIYTQDGKVHVDIRKFSKGGSMCSRSGKKKMMWRGGSVSDINSRTESVATDDLRDELRAKMQPGDVVLNFSYTDYGGDFFDKVAIDYFLEKYPHNIVVEGTAWNGRNAFVFGKPAADFLEESANYLLGFETMEDYFSTKENEEQEKGYEYFVDNTLSNYEFDRDEVLKALRDKFDGYFSINTQGLDYSESKMLDYLKEKELIAKEEDEEFSEGGTMKGAERNKAIYKYIIDAIDPDAYEVKAESDADKIKFLWETFLNEFGHEIKRQGVQKAFMEWISGLPSSFNIDFENYRILEIGKEWGILKPDATDRQEDNFLESWWNRIYMAVCNAARKNKVELTVKYEEGGVTAAREWKYRLETWDYTTYEDSFENGEGAQVSHDHQKVNKTFNSADELLKACSKIMGTEFKKENFVSFEDGRVISSTTVDNDMNPASERELEQWKKNKLKLYSAHFNFYIVAVEEKIPTAQEIAAAFGIEMYAKGGTIRCRECDKSMATGGSTSIYGNELLDYLLS